SSDLNALNFVYIPVPHGAIPDSAVTALGKALANSPGPVLLYCRSGRRAARTWSLVEASRTGGLDAAQIIATVKASGQEVDDLKDALEQRIAARSTPAEGAP
ncbi:MAG: beta-lactamase hydrolase domain-containing protein, partial [Massilia sp.]